MSDPVAPSAYSKDNPFPARVTENRLLSGPGSAKETRHFIVNIAGSGLHYKPGDSMGVFPSNRPQEVEAILARLGADGTEPVMLPKATHPIPVGEALASRLALADPTRRIVETLAGKATDPSEKSKLEGLLTPESKDLLAGWLDEREFIDLLCEFPSARLGPQELVDHLRKLMPRSIRSPPRGVHPTRSTSRSPWPAMFQTAGTASGSARPSSPTGWPSDRRRPRSSSRIRTSPFPRRDRGT